jgi:alpha-L-rhamnosidase
MNVGFYDASRFMGKMSGAVDMKDNFSARADPLKDGVLAHLWNGETGTIRMSDTCSPSGICKDINGYAITTRIAPLHFKSASILAAPRIPDRLWPSKALTGGNRRML